MHESTDTLKSIIVSKLEACEFKYINMRLKSTQCYLKDLHSGLTADHDRCGGVGSEDVGSRGLPTLVVVAVTGIVPKTPKHTFFFFNQLSFENFRQKPEFKHILFLFWKKHQPVEVLWKLYGLFGFQVAETGQKASVRVKGHLKELKHIV